MSESSDNFPFLPADAPLNDTDYTGTWPNDGLGESSSPTIFVETLLLDSSLDVLYQLPPPDLDIEDADEHLPHTGTQRDDLEQAFSYPREQNVLLSCPELSFEATAQPAIGAYAHPPLPLVPSQDAATYSPVASASISPFPGHAQSDWQSFARRALTYTTAAAGGMANLPLDDIFRFCSPNESNAAARSGDLQLMRRTSESIRLDAALGEQRPTKRACRNVTSAPTPQTPSGAASIDPRMDPVLTANPNWQLGASLASPDIEGWNAGTRRFGEWSTPPPGPPSLTLDTKFLQLPRTPQRGSPAVSSPASSVRSARRTPTEMRSSPSSFRCDQVDCGFGFDSREDLRHHERNHGNRPYVCVVCSKGFLHPKDLRRHDKTHNTDPNLRFYCPNETCKMHTQGFNREDHLARHMRTLHDVADSVTEQVSSASSMTFPGDFGVAL